jgi:hypothetical protein
MRYILNIKPMQVAEYWIGLKTERLKCIWIVRYLKGLTVFLMRLIIIVRGKISGRCILSFDSTLSVFCSFFIRISLICGLNICSLCLHYSHMAEWFFY